MKKMKFVIYAVCLTVMSSQAMLAEMLEIKSVPEKVNVFVKNPATGQESKVGTTPLKLDFDAVTRNYTKSKNFMVILRKEDYEPYRVVMTKPKSADVALLANLDLINKVESTKKYDRLINDLFDAQRLVRSKSYDAAINKLTTLEKDHRNISVIYEMKAMAYYMKKNINESLSYYRKAFSVNPTNKDAYTMKAYLEKEMGLNRSPASK